MQEKVLLHREILPFPVFRGRAFFLKLPDFDVVKRHRPCREPHMRICDFFKHRACQGRVISRKMVLSIGFG